MGATSTAYRFKILRILQKLELLEQFLTADLSERNAERAKYAANSANAARIYVGNVVVVGDGGAPFDAVDVVENPVILSHLQRLVVVKVRRTPSSFLPRKRGRMQNKDSDSSLRQVEIKWVTFWKNIL